jgi:hypothetical protein
MRSRLRRHADPTPTPRASTQDRTRSFMRRMAFHPAGVATVQMIAPNMIP